MLKEGLSIRVPHSPALSSVASLTTPRATRHFLHKLTDQYFFTHDLSPLQKGYVTAEAQCSQKKSIVWLRRVLFRSNAENAKNECSSRSSPDNVRCRRMQDESLSVLRYPNARRCLTLLAFVSLQISANLSEKAQS